MKPAGKTPYEIRLELLQLAFEILSAKCNTASECIGDKPSNSPTTEEVILEADKMNAFISKASQQH